MTSHGSRDLGRSGDLLPAFHRTGKFLGGAAAVGSGTSNIVGCKRDGKGTFFYEGITAFAKPVRAGIALKIPELTYYMFSLAHIPEKNKKLRNL